MKDINRNMGQRCENRREKCKMDKLNCWLHLNIFSDIVVANMWDIITSHNMTFANNSSKCKHTELSWSHSIRHTQSVNPMTSNNVGRK